MEKLSPLSIPIRIHWASKSSNSCYLQSCVNRSAYFHWCWQQSMTSVSCMLSLRSSPQTSTGSFDVNYYPDPESNFCHHPIGIGVQGLADAFTILWLPFESDSACELNHQIFETIYHGALETSCELSERDGMYEMYKGSPASQGELQYDLWGVTPTNLWDWKELKVKIANHSLRTLCFFTYANHKH